MIPEQQLLDKLTRQDELLAMMIPILEQIKDKGVSSSYAAPPPAPSGDLAELVAMWKFQQDIEFDPFTIIHPTDGSRLTIAEGTTTFDFAAGTVTAPGVDIVSMGKSLLNRRKEFMRALKICADQDVILQLDSGDKTTMVAGGWLFPYQQFKTLKVITTTKTDISVSASTSPKALHSEPVSIPLDGAGRADTTVQSVLGFDIPILLHETFDHPSTGWTVTGNAGDYSALRSLDAAYFGAFGYRMKTRVTGAAANDWVQVAKSFAVSTLPEILVSAFFRIANTATETKEFGFLARNQFSGLQGTAGIKYIPGDSAWSYLNAAGTYTEFLTNVDLCENHWHNAIMRSKTTSGYYGIVKIDGHEIDLSTKAIHIAANPGVVDSYTCECKTIATGATSVTTDIDNIIVRYS